MGKRILKLDSEALGLNSFFFFFWFVFCLRINIFIFLIYLFFNWPITALQNCVGFCQTSTWISHRFEFWFDIWVPWWLNSKESARNTGAIGDTGLSLGQEDPLEKGMATHSSILAWRIPWTEESGGLQSMGLQRVGHDWSDLAQKY